MKSIRISEDAYAFLSRIAKAEKRPISATLDLFIEIFKEADYEQESQMARKSLSKSIRIKD